MKHILKPITTKLQEYSICKDCHFLWECIDSILAESAIHAEIIEPLRILLDYAETVLTEEPNHIPASILKRGLIEGLDSIAEHGHSLRVMAWLDEYPKVRSFLEDLGTKVRCKDVEKFLIENVPEFQEEYSIYQSENSSEYLPYVAFENFTTFMLGEVRKGNLESVRNGVNTIEKLIENGTESLINIIGTTFMETLQYGDENYQAEVDYLIDNLLPETAKLLQHYKDLEEANAEEIKKYNESLKKQAS
jgi:hypothetical protein